MQMAGAELYYHCDGCGQAVSDDDDMMCECEPDDYYFGEDHEEEHP
jgi:hypothetical protein